MMKKYLFAIIAIGQESKHFSALTGKGGMRMADRKKTIENLEQLAKDDWILRFNDNDVKKIAKAFNEIAKAVLELLKEQDWVKCSERMPEERESIFARFKGTDKWNKAMFEKISDDVRVVVVFPDGTRRVSHSHTVDGKWECEKSPVKRIVTHWMPNPELPKEDR